MKHGLASVIIEKSMMVCHCGHTSPIGDKTHFNQVGLYIPITDVEEMWRKAITMQRREEE